ncbi:hypothetical protein INR49_031460 [Caranx melampygus]|nr:hypothetical protein INR49_031460 [Caranx melampygus]
MKTHVLITSVVVSLWLQVHCQDVTQHPAVSFTYLSKSMEMNCSHNRDISYSKMYWFKQRPGETMMQIVYISYGGRPDYVGGGENQTKYSATKDNIQTGALIVKNLQLEDSGLCLGFEVHQSASDLIVSQSAAKVQISCSYDRADYFQILWYQQSPGDTAMKLIGYLSYKDPKMEEKYTKDFQISGDLSESTGKNGSLIVTSLTQEHSAVYYCAASKAQ